MLEHVQAAEGDVGETAVPIFVRLDQASNHPVTVSLSAIEQDGQALEDIDYLPLVAELRFEPGELEQTVTLTILGDEIDERDETVRLELSNATVATLEEPAAELTILDDDAPSIVSVTSVQVAEAAAEAVFGVALDRVSGQDITVVYLTADGEATAGLDYTPSAGSLSIPAGSLATAIPVPVLDDGIDEPEESFVLQLVEAEHATLGAAVATGTILDDDAPPTLSIRDTAILEGESDTTLRFPVELSVESGFEIAVSYQSTDGADPDLRPATGGVDYLPVSGELRIAPGAVGTTVEVTVLGDAIDELDEFLTITLSQPSHAVLLESSAIGTILDDDEARLSVGDRVVDEGDDGESEAIFSVDLSVASDRTVGVDYRTSPETASEGEDYRDRSGSLSFEPGDQERTVAVPVLGDRLFEEDETFQLSLENATEATIDDGDALGTILDDERCLGPNLLLSGSGESYPWTGWIELTGAWTFGFASPAAIDGDAYLVGEGELIQDIDLSAFADRIDGTGLSFLISAGLGQNAGSTAHTRLVAEFRDATNSAVLGIWDSGAIMAQGTWAEVSHEEIAPSGTRFVRFSLQSLGGVSHFDGLRLSPLRLPIVSASDVTVYENESVPASFEVRLSCPIDGELTLQATTADGTAQSGEDYVSSASDVHIAQGENTVTLDVEVLADGIEEGEETFYLELSEPIGPYQPVSFGGGKATILDGRACPRSPGYWKNHQALWPLQWLRLGDVVEDAPTMLSRLQYGGPDASSTLARQLVATRLNLAKGTDPFILPIAEAAEAFLIAHPPGSDPRGALRSEALALKDQLDAYNNLDCQDLGGDGGGTGGGGGGGSGGGDDGGGDGGGDSACPRSPGYWKTHHPDWPSLELELGAVVYGDLDLLDFLGANASDASRSLARQLVAAKFNLLSGTDPSIQGTVDEADLFLTDHPPGSKPKGQDRNLALELQAELDAYNNAACP